jgi:hypothetical protein
MLNDLRWFIYGAKLVWKEVRKASAENEDLIGVLIDVRPVTPASLEGLVRDILENFRMPSPAEPPKLIVADTEWDSKKGTQKN